MTQRYEVKGKIGHGGLGEVYLAYDTQLDREVALKRVRPQEEDEAGAKSLAVDLVREAKTLSSLQHPNIVTIYDVGRDEQGPFVIMEYLKGETLEAVVERGRLGVEDFREIVLQAMEGMVAAQSLGLVHRDLKPGNLMVNWLPSGKLQLKILDFGLAKFSKTAVPQTQDQEAGIFGSIFFMAPEQFERLPLDARTDMYSLGCIFYQLLSGQHPFDGRTPVDVMVSHLQHLVKPLHEHRGDLPAWMADWVMWLISREMEDRPAGAGHALELFLAQRSGLPGAAPVRPGTPTPRVVPRPVAAAQSSPAPRAGTAAMARGSRGRVRRADGRHKVVATSKLSYVTVLTGTLIFLGAAWGIWKVYKAGHREVEDPRAILARYQGAEAEGDATTVTALLSLAESGGKNATDSLGVLKKLKGQGVPQAIAAALLEAKGAQRDLLMEATGAQPSKEGMTLLMKLAGDVPEAETRMKALSALAIGCAPSEVVELLSHAIKFQEEPVRGVYYKTVEQVLKKQADRDERVKALAPALKTAGPSSQPAIFRLLSASGSPEANKVLAGEISAAGDRRKAAVEAVKSWNAPDQAIADALFDAAKSGDRDVFTGAYAHTVTRVPTLTSAEVVEALRKAQPFVDSIKSRGDYAAALATLGSREALTFATELSSGPDTSLAFAVRPELERITKQEAAALKLTAGANVLDASAAVIIGEGKDAEYLSTVRYVSGWRNSRTKIAWDIIVPESLTVEVEVVLSSVRAGNSFYVTLGSASVELDVVMTKSSDDFMRVSAGTFSLPKPGPARLWLEAGRMTEKEALMNVRSVSIKVK